MWLWFGSLPLSWLLGIPFGGFLDPHVSYGLSLFGPPSLTLAAAMVSVLIGMGFLARRALNY
jgi:hypothetical protein